MDKKGDGDKTETECWKRNREMTTRDKLLACGREHFLEFGFKSASLRKIVAEAGFTSGAFYGYFPSKEALFYAITDETARQMGEIFSPINAEVEAIPAAKKFPEMCSVYIRKIPDIVDFILEHREEMRMLLTCSEGTKYEDFFGKLQKCNVDAVVGSIQNTEVAEKLTPYTIDLLMGGFFSMLSRVILEQSDREMICRCLTEIVRVYAQGFLHLSEE